ncbi:hypothetical protein [Krasilnikovia cinnamomea]|nr:hypothetical protein [Krasilnikovia cinnamomea]
MTLQAKGWSPDHLVHPFYSAVVVDPLEHWFNHRYGMAAATFT